MEVGGQLHAPAALPPGVRTPGTHYTGGWMGSRAGLDAVAKRKVPIPAPAGKWTPVVQPIAQSLYWLSYPGSRIITVMRLNEWSWKGPLLLSHVLHNTKSRNNMEENLDSRRDKWISNLQLQKLKRRTNIKENANCEYVTSASLEGKPFKLRLHPHSYAAGRHKHRR
jgi:hypothetical protein